ncbi:MAG TPA: hypothetical protein VGO78_16260 [Acidimicrobiales bacterium]|nr:hypothetical protein [Acidimicrobiales bacterium]
MEHRWAGLDRRTIGPAAGVLVLVLLWAIVLPAVDRAVSQEREVEAGTVLGVGRGVTFVPAVGWNIDDGLTAAQAHGKLPSALVAKVTTGGTSVEVRTVTWDGDLEALLARVNEINEDENDPGWHVTGPQHSVTTADGATGLGEESVAPAGPGRIYAFLHDEVGVEVVVTSTHAEEGQHRSAIDDMVASISFGDGA